jgi:hypothetical protein
MLGWITYRLVADEDLIGHKPRVAAIRLIPNAPSAGRRRLWKFSNPDKDSRRAASPTLSVCLLQRRRWRN